MLRPLRVLLVVVLVLFAAGSFAASAPADDDDDDDRGTPQFVDFTTGNGRAQFGLSTLSTFDFHVQSGPNGESATGFATLTSAAGLPYSGSATCLTVSGSRAVFEIDNTNPATIAFDVVVFVGDFGAGGVGDEFNFDHITQADGVCPGPAGRENSVIQGDIVVRDNALAPSGDDDDDEDEDDDDEDDDEDDADEDDDD
jgi:hypothetical protein